MSEPTKPLNFVQEIIEEDNRTGKWENRVHTRFPPEPNGYLHIGHAKAICLNFGLAEQYGGKCNLRFDDTNPVKEEDEYVQSIIEDIRWLGFDWEGEALFASSYFEEMRDHAITLIKKGLAYVCDLSAEEMRAQRGTLKDPGTNSPFRDRSVEENLDLFERMAAGEFPDGSKTLRAKIDMASPNVNLRDPAMYRILHAEHHRTGNRWSIYPMYDWAHGLEDSIEGITHSICTLEFENHRPLYDWFLKALGVHHPQQIEFARLELTHTVMSKRKLLTLVEEGHVMSWDDPRMPTLSGLRRRGFTPESVKAFCADVGVAKSNSLIDITRMENAARDHLNAIAPRVMGVINPLKIVIENYPEGESEMLEAVNNPEDPNAGTREIPFGRELYIEREDFMEDPPKKFFRLSPGTEVRLRYAYFVTCTDVIKDANGEITEIRCTYDPATRGGDAPDGRRVKGTLHWVSAAHAIDAEVRLIDRLFSAENPNSRKNSPLFRELLNPESMTVMSGCKLEPSLAEAEVGVGYQFERLGYFTKDRDSTETMPVFNRTVSLRDSWAKIQNKG